MFLIKFFYCVIEREGTYGTFLVNSMKWIWSPFPRVNRSASLRYSIFEKCFFFWTKAHTVLFVSVGIGRMQGSTLVYQLLENGGGPLPRNK